MRDDARATQAPRPAYFTVQEFAALVGCCDETILVWIKTGKVEAIRVGRIYRIPRPELPRLREKFRIA